MEIKLVKRVGAWSIFKFTFVLSLIVFLISYVFLIAGYLITVATGLTQTNEQFQQFFQNLGASGAVFLIIVFFGGLFGCLLQAILGSISALIYNLIAMMTGGVEVRVEEK